MRKTKQWWVLLLTMSVLAAFAGCPKEDSPEGTEQANGADDGVAQDPVDKGSASRTRIPEPPPELTKPKVRLTEKDRATCRIQEGQAIPEGQLRDFSGQTHSLSQLYGEKLTVLFFWQSGETAFAEMAVEDALESLAKDYAKPLLEKGVQVIGVNVGDPPQMAEQRITNAEAEFAQLLDSDGTFFSEIATEKLPRVYLLDAAGKIVWFDLEFSEITRKDLSLWIELDLDEGNSG